MNRAFPWLCRVVAVLLLLLAVVKVRDTVAQPAALPTEERVGGIIRMYDARAGVACYRIVTQVNALSCVKVRP